MGCGGEGAVSETQIEATCQGRSFIYCSDEATIYQKRDTSYLGEWKLDGHDSALLPPGEFLIVVDGSWDSCFYECW